FIFFFQAEDGIRDKLVTGVQTCALPILQVSGSSRLMTGEQTPALVALLHSWQARSHGESQHTPSLQMPVSHSESAAHGVPLPARSEERRVGKEGRSRWGGREWRSMEVWA